MIPTREQIEFRDLARRFARERLKPGYQARERHGRLDRGLLREMGALGLVGVELPAEHGGLGADGVTAGLLIEEIAYADINVSYIQLLASLLGSLIARFAHPSVARTWLPRVIAGEAVVGLGLTEPRGGSDAANLVLRADRHGEEYVLNGEKNSMSFADQADAMIVFARTGPRESGARGVSA
ncbi:MAG: acyl-CoA dehydrogenase family protein, partial [Acetobacteraceae bacterium]|nr:acyl-CoA dehydrogenase family protein [Acetobacteraceae bacterium]